MPFDAAEEIRLNEARRRIRGETTKERAIKLGGALPVTLFVEGVPMLDHDTSQPTRRAFGVIVDEAKIVRIKESGDTAALEGYRQELLADLAKKLIRLF